MPLVLLPRLHWKSPHAPRSRLIKRMKSLGGLLILGLAAGAASALAATFRPEEMAEARRWLAAKVEPPAAGPRCEPGLVVLANHDPVLRNTRGGGRPLDDRQEPYSRGLYCHAVSKMLVRLPGPGKTFTAVVGVDSNEQTRRAGKRRLLRARRRQGGVPLGVMHEGIAGVPVTRGPRRGARSSLLEVGDAGDGIGWDQADWADAKVELADGTTVWLGDLPILEARRPVNGRSAVLVHLRRQALGRCC